MQRHIEVKKNVKQIRQAHIQQRTVEEMEGSPTQQIQELMSTQFLQEQVSESIVEQLADVAEPPHVPAVTQRQQIPSKKRGPKFPWKKSWKSPCRVEWRTRFCVGVGARYARSMD